MLYNTHNLFKMFNKCIFTFYTQFYDNLGVSPFDFFGMYHIAQDVAPVK